VYTLCPSCHDPPVIVGDYDDLVDTLCLEFIEVLDVRLNVLLLAGWRERARNGNQHDLLLLEFCVEEKSVHRMQRAWFEDEE
jgi:hypothetical protein